MFSPPTPTRSDLQLWLRAQLTSVSIRFESTVTRTYSPSLSFGGVDSLDSNIVSVLGSQDDGWISMRLKLSLLDDTRGEAAYNSIVFRDISGAIPCLLLGTHVRTDTPARDRMQRAHHSSRP
jgi:hypothetical protein